MNGLLDVKEKVCSGCPGTLWGEKSICRVHDKSIGQVKDCPEWQQESLIENKSGQLALFDLEPAIEVIQKVEEELKDYHWMVKEVDRLRKYLAGAGEGLTRQYGIDSAMPKAKGGASDPVNREIERRWRQWNRLEKLEEKLKKIETATDAISDEKEKTVLECILDGERMNIIAKHVGVSRQRLNEIKRGLVKKLAWEMFGDELKVR